MSSAIPLIVSASPRTPPGFGWVGHGMKRSQRSAFAVWRVSSMPPVKRTVPAMNIRYAEVSLWRDSSAFSCRYSLSDIMVVLVWAC